METEVEIKKIETEPRRSIPAIAVTAVAMTLALAAIIALQMYVGPTATNTQQATQTQAR
jgi:hypothetical protein